jgi:hypothetical protein
VRSPSPTMTMSMSAPTHGLIGREFYVFGFYNKTNTSFRFPALPSPPSSNRKRENNAGAQSRQCTSFGKLLFKTFYASNFTKIEEIDNLLGTARFDRRNEVTSLVFVIDSEASRLNPHIKTR